MTTRSQPGDFVLREIAGNGGGEAFEHWLATGKYLYEGVEYNHPPHQIEVDVGRGVLYIHSLMIGKTVLRICRIPDIVMIEGLVYLPKHFWSMSLGLKTTPSGKGMSGHPLWRRGHVMVVKKEPVFFVLPDFFQMAEGGSFSVADEAGSVVLTVDDVPVRIMKSLWLGEFADITIGVTRR